MKKKIKISTFIYFIWILIGISIIISPYVFKNNFNIEVGKKIITCYVIASTIIPLIYSRIKK